MFVNDFSRKTWVYFLKEKSEVFKTFKKFKALVEKESGFEIVAIRSNRGGEFTSNEFEEFCEQNGIRHSLTASYTPQQNGVRERRNRTIMNMAQSMLKSKKMAKELWVEAVDCAAYLLNRCLTRNVWDKTPLEAWSGIKPGISHLRVFGSIAYAHVPDQKRSKIDDKSAKYVFIGYDARKKGYKLYGPIMKKLIISRDVEFNEKPSWDWNVPKEEIYDFFPLLDDEEREHRGVREPQSPSSPQTPVTPNQDESSLKSPNSSPYLGESSSSVGPRGMRSL